MSISEKTYIIAEAGLNHNGSLKKAFELIDLASDAGADAVKFQKRTIEDLATKEVLDQEDNRFPQFGRTYREIREFLEFDFDDYVKLKDYSESKNLDFICTAFDVNAVIFLEKLNLKVYKLASHSLTNLTLIDYISKLKKKIILSTGMASIEEIESAVNILNKNNCDYSLLYCVSAYPTPLNECNLNVINTLKNYFGIPIGYSGHEIGYLPTLVAVSMGSSIIERHITLDKDLPGFDHKISLNPKELHEMIKLIRDIDIIKVDSLKKVSDTEMITRKKYHVSAVSSLKIKKGTVITKEMIVYKNPGVGISPSNSEKIIGKRAKNDIPEDVLLSIDMVES
jgi:sialic acid synthase SpsE